MKLCVACQPQRRTDATAECLLCAHRFCFEHAIQHFVSAHGVSAPISEDLARTIGCLFLGLYTYPTKPATEAAYVEKIGLLWETTERLWPSGQAAEGKAYAAYLAMALACGVREAIIETHAALAEGARLRGRKAQPETEPAQKPGRKG